MTQQSKTLLIISVDRKVNNFLRTIIHNIIGSAVKLRSQTLVETLAKSAPADVVMTSGPFLVPRVKPMFPNAPIIAPRRLITGYNLEKVLMLPRGSRVLVVNNPRSATENTIESLKSLGITHLDYIPYWKGSKRDLGSLNTAISPGMSHLCPKKISRVIDIGPRIISIHSFLELLRALELDSSYLENYATYYHNFLMESSRKMALVLEQSELLRKYQEVILDQFEDGLISVNESGHIDIVNTSAARMLKRTQDALLAASIADILSQLKHTVNLTDETQENGPTSTIYEYDSRQFLVQRIPVMGKDMERSVYTFREISGIQRLEKDVRVHLARKGYVTKYDFDDIWTASETLRRIKEKALNFATTEKNILITGESGTGKELFAHAIHRGSPRREGPFVAVNFAGIPEGLIESELFGYEPGAFTGAKKGGKTGLFEQAHGGTIFLDEIGDAPLSVQSRLLRVLQEKEIMRVGGDKITPVDVRILAGTNRDLQEAILERKFRKDLYYRLNTLPLEIPPLRDHKEDILYVLNRYVLIRYGVTKDFAESAVECLVQYDWPGNKRELINIADYICISSRGARTIGVEHLPQSLVDACMRCSSSAAAAGIDSCEPLIGTIQNSSLSLELIRAILEVLDERNRSLNGRRSLVRELLGRNHAVTEGSMKRYLKILKDAGAIKVGITKQGVALTNRGKHVLSSLKSKSWENST